MSEEKEKPKKKNYGLPEDERQTVHILERMEIFILLLQEPKELFVKPKFLKRKLMKYIRG